MSGSLIADLKELLARHQNQPEQIQPNGEASAIMHLVSRGTGSSRVVYLCSEMGDNAITREELAHFGINYPTEEQLPSTGATIRPHIVLKITMKVVR